eukprot:gnl/MRDRNA2_/MRDRNA2_71779_c0_seq1.p1 gnl/MRDRNA2_/MRDRNA2_71779_c0~~gnl/MRDRNA2_/MRDRNA2_71779_c0_seq1.p1  ORF type:complete len:217 (-),score=56.19 gnl/MRDRNA2_/MRDRNA2_71779_c0_seq1:95-745(-)
MEEDATAVPQLKLLEKAKGTNFEQFVIGFQDYNFESQVEEFVRLHASSFCVACPDGSHPLEWTYIHKEYSAMFDTQLDRILEDIDVTREEFTDWIMRLREFEDHFQEDFDLPGCDGLKAGELSNFLKSLTASEDYMLFVQVMIQEILKQQRGAAATGETPETSAVVPEAVEIDITVPEGTGPGQLIAVEYLGTRYELVVPDGVGPGMLFRASVAPP